jgi:hypothetical protein
MSVSKGILYLCPRKAEPTEQTGLLAQSQVGVETTELALSDRATDLLDQDETLGRHFDRYITEELRIGR